MSSDPPAASAIRKLEQDDDCLSRVGGQCSVGRSPTAEKTQMGRLER